MAGLELYTEWRWVISKNQACVFACVIVEGYFIHCSHFSSYRLGVIHKLKFITNNVLDYIKIREQLKSASYDGICYTMTLTPVCPLPCSRKCKRLCNWQSLSNKTGDCTVYPLLDNGKQTNTPFSRIMPACIRPCCLPDIILIHLRRGFHKVVTTVCNPETSGVN